MGQFTAGVQGAKEQVDRAILTRWPSSGRLSGAAARFESTLGQEIRLRSA